MGGGDIRSTEILTENHLIESGIQAEGLFVLCGKRRGECALHKLLQYDALRPIFVSAQMRGVLLRLRKFFPDMRNRFQQFVLVNGFREIEADAASDGFLRVFKVSVTA